MLLLLLASSIYGQIPPSMRLHEALRCVCRVGDDARPAHPGFDDTEWGAAPEPARRSYLRERWHFAAIPDAVPGELDLQFRVMAVWILSIDGQVADTFLDPRTGWH